MARQPLRAVRVPDALWEQAKAKAKAEGVSVSAVINGALEVWVGAEMWELETIASIAQRIERDHPN